MANIFEFIDNGKSFNINFNNIEYTAGKNDVEMVVPDISANDVLEIRSNSAQFTDIKVYFPQDTITGVGAGSTTATQLRDALEAIFFLEVVSTDDLDLKVNKSGDTITGNIVFDASLVNVISGVGITIEPTNDGAVIYLDASAGDIDQVLGSAANYINKDFTFKRTTNGGNVVRLSPATGENTTEISSSCTPSREIVSF